MSLRGLIAQVKDEDDVTLQQIADRAGLPLSTVGAYATGRRGAETPPSMATLQALARGLGRPLVIVCAAAGRVYPGELEREAEEHAEEIAALWAELPPEDQQVVRDLLLVLYRRHRGDPDSGADPGAAPADDTVV